MTRKSRVQKQIPILRWTAAVMIFVGVGLVALYVWQNGDASSDGTGSGSRQSSSSSESVKPLKPADTAATKDWQTYTDEFISFRYPQGWSTNRQYTFSDFYQAHVINITAPVDTSLKAANPEHANLYLEASLTLYRDKRFPEGCAGCGKVFAMQKVALADGTQANLLVADSGQPDQPAIIDTVRDGVSIGDASYAPAGFRIADQFNLRVLASYNSTSTSLVGFPAVNNITDSSQYKQLLNIIETMKVDDDNLPQES